MRFEAYADNRDDSMDPFARAITSVINAPVAKLEIAAVAEELFLTEIFLITDWRILLRSEAEESKPFDVKILSVKLFIKDEVSICSDRSETPAS